MVLAAGAHHPFAALKSRPVAIGLSLRSRPRQRTAFRRGPEVISLTQLPCPAAPVEIDPQHALMRIRTRKLIGTVALLVLVAVWALLAMALAQIALPAGASVAAGLYYVVAGLGWVLPAMPLIAWMVRPDPPSDLSERR